MIIPGNRIAHILSCFRTAKKNGKVAMVSGAGTVTRAKKKGARQGGASVYYFLTRSFIISFSRYISLLKGLKSRESAITL